jgi:pimeloyl-ACP methyl ester carboxylesterase
MDALGIESAVLAGFDWGSRTGDIIAALWPKRCQALVSVSGYLITNLAANKLPLAAEPGAERAGVRQHRETAPASPRHRRAHDYY